MENFNNVPSQGKFGDSVAVVNENFLLAQQEMEVLENLISPDTKHVTVSATQQTTSVTQILPETGSTDTVYRVGAWDGTQYNDSVFSEYAWDGSAYIKLSTKSQAGEVYDISANHSDTKYADLAAALGTNGANIPQEIRKGGMSVKYVQSSDNKYIQARCMAQNFTTDVTQWQGVDDEPIAASNNLLKSGGAAKILGMLTDLLWQAGSINGNTGEDTDWDVITRQRTGFIPVSDVDTVIGASSVYSFMIFQYNSQQQYLSVYSSDWISENKYLFTDDLDSNCVYIRICSKTTDSQTPPIECIKSNGILERLENAEDDISNLQDSVGELDNTTALTALLDNTVNSIKPIWERGSIDSNTGKDSDWDVITRQRTVGYIKANYNEVFGHETPFDYSIYQYDSNHEFIAVASADWEISDKQFTFNASCKYIRIVSKTINSATPTFALKDGNKDSVIKDLANIRNDVDSLNIDVYGIHEYITPNVYWEDGGINSNTGTDLSTSTTRKRTIGYISINDCNKISNYSSPYDYTVYQYAEDKSYIRSIPSDWRTSDWEFGDYLDASCKYIRIACKTIDSVTPTFVLKKTATKGIKEKIEELEQLDTDTIIVDANGNGDYTNVADALANAGDTVDKHVTIIVRQGTYLMPPKVSSAAPYAENNRNLTIKGDDMYLCVLYNNIGFYDYTIQTDCAPLRLNGNVRIENLTIISRSTEFDNYVNTEGYVPRDDYRKASYCIHRDGNNAANTKFVVKDCILINDHMTCIGFGLKPNTELIIENVYAQSEQAAEHSKANDYGTIYGHFKANDKGLGQNLSVIRCQLVNKTSNQAINIMDAKASDATPQDTFGTFKFIGNAVNTTDKTTSLAIVSSIAGFYEIDGLSFDNAWE